ncbi:hypothetical protein [Pseudodesulfovibrio indicus]|uniref:hypothetical protein n=1 Tax=Pseudodesulfovibrio indicus TaxID=1716143 RepID=UPI00292F4129|nr:hypothetical protein [Pseudodesulfovibrio indicus]
MKGEVRQPSLAPAVLAAVALGVVAILAVAWFHWGWLTDNAMVLDGVPAVGNNDGYFHLDRATALAEQGAWLTDALTDPRPSMLLSHLLALFAGADRALLHLLAACAGPLSGLAMFLAVLPWAADTRSRFTILAAPLLAVMAPYWVVRTHVGFLDTDGVAVGLCFLALYCVRRFSTGPAPAWVAAYILATAVTWLWWRPGAYLCLCFLLLYAVYPPRNRCDGAFKIAIIGGVLLAAGLAAAGVKPFSGVGTYVAAHVELAFGGGDRGLLGSAVRELAGANVAELGHRALGASWLLIPALLGTVVHVLRDRARALFLASGWLFGAASLYSQRFIPFFVPVAAAYAAYGAAFCLCLIDSFAGRAGRGPLRAAIAFAALAALLAGSAANLTRYRPEPYFQRADFDLAEVVKRSFSADTVIWTWWDYGYFFQYLTGMKTFFDGGSQTGTTCFAAAYPLMQSEPARGAAWMRHFAATFPRFDESRRGAGWQRYAADLAESLVREDDGGGPPVALVLPARVYGAAGYLYAFAHLYDEQVPPVRNRLDLFAARGFSYDEGAGAVTVPEAMIAKGYETVGSVLDGTGRDPAEFDFASLADPYLVFSRHADFVAVTDREMVPSVFFRLLGLFAPAPDFFRPVTFDYRTGGAWRVAAGS